MPTLETHNGYALWHYIPSIAAAIIFAILFFAVTSYNVFRMIKSRAWFCIPLCIGGLFEIIGYCGRASAYDRTGQLLPYIIQSIFILLGPILMAATVYMVSGRIITRTNGEPHSFVPARWLTRIFVGSDVFSFLVQSSGAGLMVQSSSTNMGRILIVAGLVLQVVGFGIFVTTGALFYVRMRKVPTRASVEYGCWERVMRVSGAMSILLLIRFIFRVVEYAMGNDGYPLHHEWTLYVFDAVLIFSAMVLFGVYHPGRIRKTIDETSQEELVVRYGEAFDNKSQRGRLEG
ncbi:RTA1 like protein-domain-containing protein [Neohortaea acidophila]|uniref:RTA1 like protein-domain-containing protein n=1 Tax=Neohortaea acidophila TaxID=245834 RepID=A0A6A6Q101_9PEZI|nr:RTA1 like protein-domain-containing protein [Neohortaea acidophila]KAF2485666.1 RTA1 like protein-domain-containing protein [Neohortaea acidophila]